MNTDSGNGNAGQTLPAPSGSAFRCPSCCSTNVGTEAEDSVTGYVMHCKECDWTWCPAAAEEAKVMADVLYGWAMPNAQRGSHTLQRLVGSRAVGDASHSIMAKIQ